MRVGVMVRLNMVGTPFLYSSHRVLRSLRQATLREVERDMHRLIDIPLEQLRYSAVRCYWAAGQLCETASGKLQGTQSGADVPAHKVAYQRGDQGCVQRRLINCAATPDEDEPNQHPRQQQDDEDDQIAPAATLKNDAC